MHEALPCIILIAEEGRSGALIWGAMLGAVAIALLALELIFPSGLLAVGAVACIVASVWLCFLHSPLAGILALAVYLILGPIVGVFVFKWWLNSPMARHFVLRSEVDRLSIGDEGDELNDGSRTDTRRRDASLRTLIGEEGEAITPLRPVGAVRIRGQRVDALSERGSIPAGARVVVTDVYDNQVKVREQLP